MQILKIKNFLKQNYFPTNLNNNYENKNTSVENLKLDCFSSLIEISFHKEKEILFKSGDPSDKYYLILKGKINVKIPKIEKKFFFSVRI